MRLGSAGNTEGPALYILEQVKQYIVFFECSEDSDWTQWVAIKDDRQFFAESPEALLGLVNIYELVGENWNRYSSYDRKHIYQRNLDDFINESVTNARQIFVRCKDVYNITGNKKINPKLEGAI